MNDFGYAQAAPKGREARIGRPVKAAISFCRSDQLFLFIAGRADGKICVAEKPRIGKIGDPLPVWRPCRVGAGCELARVLRGGVVDSDFAFRCVEPIDELLSIGRKKLRGKEWFD